MKKTLMKIAGVIFGILLALMAIEILLRLFDANSASFGRPDNVLGNSFIPNAYYKYKPPEGCPGWGSEGYINSHGLRDYEYDYVKPAGTFRILALGDSYTEGLQHPLEVTWTKLLEKQLNDREDGNIYEVINAGRSGMGTAQEYLFYTHEGYRYSPDLVILLVFSNDIVDNSKELSTSKDAGPFFTTINDQLVLDDSFNQSRAFKIRSNIEPFKTKSYLISALTRAYNNLMSRDAANSAIDSNQEKKNVQKNEIEKAVNVTQRLLIELNQAVLNNGSQMVVFNIDDKSIAGPIQLNQMLTDVTEKYKIPYFDLFPDLEKYSQSTGAYIFGCAENNGEGHWSQTGHAQASKFMYWFLLSLRMFP